MRREGPENKPTCGGADLAGALALIRDLPEGADRPWLLVDVGCQRLFRMQGDQALGSWPVSTAETGLDNREGSGGTPPGLHRIAERIGDGQPEGAVFVSREPTGEVWPGGPDPRGRDLILTRILTLDGLQEGLNAGPGIDSRERYIYLHGTDREDLLGSPASHGCIRLASRDILEVFALVREGDAIVIL